MQKLLKLILVSLSLLGILQSNVSAVDTTQQTAFIERFYQNILDRSADTEGMNTWLNTIQTESATKVALGFFKSQEFINKNLSNEEFVDILYQTLFDRQADTDGKTDWLSKLNNNTYTKNEVMYGFFNAQEFANLANRFGVTQIRPEDQLNAGTTGVDGYVNRFYSLVLNRTADDAGFVDWTTQLNNQTKGGGDIAKGFFNSQEYLNRNLDNSTFLDICYRAFFDREADEGGKSNWTTLLSQGASKDAILDGFIGSQEFIALAARFGIQRTSLNYVNSSTLLGDTLTKVTSDERYTVSYTSEDSIVKTNSVAEDLSAQRLVLTTYKSNILQSRTEVKDKFSELKDSFSATISIDVTDNYSRGQVNAYMYKINDERDLWVGINIKKNQISYSAQFQNTLTGDVISEFSSGSIIASEVDYTENDRFNCKISLVDSSKLVLEVKNETLNETYPSVEINIPSASTYNLGFTQGKVRSQRDYTSSFDAYTNADIESKVYVYAVSSTKLQPLATAKWSDISAYIETQNLGSDWMGYNTISGNTVTFKDYNYDGSTYSLDEEDSFSINKNYGNEYQANFSDGSKSAVGTISNTYKVNNFDGIVYSDLYKSTMTFELNQVEEDTYTWDWDNPSYWDDSINQSVSITNFSTLVEGFTRENGNNFESGLFLEPIPSGQTTGRIIVGLTEGDHYTRTNGTILEGASWSLDNSNEQIVVNFDKKIMRISVVNQNGSYAIQVYEKTEAGYIEYNTVYTGSSVSTLYSNLVNN